MDGMQRQQPVALRLQLPDGKHDEVHDDQPKDGGGGGDGDGLLLYAEWQS